MIKRPRFYSLLLLSLVLSNVFLLKSQLPSSNSLESGSSGIGGGSNYQSTFSSSFQDGLSSSPFHGLPADNTIILYSPPSEGGDPLGIPSGDALGVVVVLSIIYGIYKKREARKI